MGTAPGHYTQNYCKSEERRVKTRRGKGKIHAARNKRKQPLQGEDREYGQDAAEERPDLSEEEMKTACDNFILGLGRTDSVSLEENTRSQFRSALWRKERLKRLTASTFGKICKMRKTTSTANTVNSLLYSDFSGNKATQYGVKNESNARYNHTGRDVVNKCKRSLNFTLKESPENLPIADNVEFPNMSVENIQVGTEIITLENPDFFLENSTVEKDVITLSQNIPLCIDIININTETGLIELNIQNILHAGLYKDHVFLHENNSLQGITTETIHSRINDTIAFYIGFIKSDILIYNINFNNCQSAAVYAGTGYRMNDKTLVARKFEKRNISNSNKKSSNTPGQITSTPIITTYENVGTKKKHYCIFCKKLIVAIGRHIITQHHSEIRVKDICKMPKKSTERKRALYLLRCEGMHAFNMQSEVKDFIVVRNPSKSYIGDFLPCPNCKGHILPINLARHEKKCTGREANRTRVVSVAAALARPIVFTSVEQKLVHRLLKDLTNDVVSDIVKSDKVILLLAKNIAVKFANYFHQMAPSRQKLRELARFILEMRKLDEQITDLASCLQPNKASLIDAVEVLKIQNIKDGLERSTTLGLDTFLTIHLKEYTVHIGKNATTILLENKWNKKSMLPTVKDVRCFQNYLMRKSETAFDILSTEYQYSHWLTLGKIVLLLLLTFNRRRVGKVSRILIENYNKRQKIQEDHHKNLTRLEHILAHQYERMKIRGKRGRRVPLLLSTMHVKYIDMLLRYRVNAGVDENNPYLFGVQHKTPYILAGNVIRKYSVLCGVSNPQKIRGTFLRKQVAT
ncbi:hypothetical protein CBL_20548 [Carabus blaptoides fortunei]